MNSGFITSKPDIFRLSGVYVQRKVRIDTMSEWFLREVRIPTLSAESGIVRDNSGIRQVVFY